MLMVHFRPNEKIDRPTRLYFLERMEENGGYFGDIEEKTCYAFFRDLADVSYMRRKLSIPKEWLNVSDEDGKVYELP